MSDPPRLTNLVLLGLLALAYIVACFIYTTWHLTGWLLGGSA